MFDICKSSDDDGQDHLLVWVVQPSFILPGYRQTISHAQHSLTHTFRSLR